MANYRPLIVNTSANQIQELNESVDALMVKEVIGISQNTDKINLGTSGNMKLEVGGEERIALSSTNAFEAIELKGSTSNAFFMNLISTHICKTSDIGFHGNLFGGQLLAWLDEAGAALSAEFAETGSIQLPNFDADDITSDKLAIKLKIETQGCTSTETITPFFSRTTHNKSYLAIFRMGPTNPKQNRFQNFNFIRSMICNGKLR